MAKPLEEQLRIANATIDLQATKILGLQIEVQHHLDEKQPRLEQVGMLNSQIRTHDGKIEALEKGKSEAVAAREDMADTINSIEIERDEARGMLVTLQSEHNELNATRGSVNQELKREKIARQTAETDLKTAQDEVVRLKGDS